MYIKSCYDVLCSLYVSLVMLTMLASLSFLLLEKVTDVLSSLFTMKPVVKLLIVGHPRRACAHALPSIPTCCRALLAILTAPVCGAALARLALCGPINGLILSLMTPLLMSVYFAKPPEESSLFDY